MTADALTAGYRASAVMQETYFSWNLPASPLDEINILRHEQSEWYFWWYFKMHFLELRCASISFLFVPDGEIDKKWLDQLMAR